MTAAEARTEALDRAKNGTSEANYPAIIAGFVAMGIDPADIQPRENVFTFGAWLAQGRSVKKGQHGVRVQTVIEGEKETEEEEKQRFKMRKFTTVFHISQTEETTRPTRAPHQEPPPLNLKPYAPDPSLKLLGLPAKLRAEADKMQPKINHANRPMTQNPTPKRNREYHARLHEARNMQRGQKALRAMADAIDAGTVPLELADLVSGMFPFAQVKGAILHMVEKGRDTSRESYYTVVEADDYKSTKPAARRLQAMIAGNSREQEHQARALKIHELEAQIALSRIPGFFPTPEPLVCMMCEIAELESGMSVLEPSAGSGAIADKIRESMPDCNLDVCEINPRLAELLILKGHNYVHQYPDFTQMPVRPTFRYDRILMNPPFENCQDINHVRLACAHLADNGVLVAVMSPHFEFAQDMASIAFRAFLEEVGASWDEIPAGAFKGAGTNVASRLLVIDKRQN